VRAGRGAVHGADAGLSRTKDMRALGAARVRREGKDEDASGLGECMVIIYIYIYIYIYVCVCV
jgi:hypothetical protein